MDTTALWRMEGASTRRVATHVSVHRDTYWTPLVPGVCLCQFASLANTPVIHMLSVLTEVATIPADVSQDIGGTDITAHLSVEFPVRMVVRVPPLVPAPVLQATLGPTVRMT